MGEVFSAESVLLIMIMDRYYLRDWEDNLGRDFEWIERSGGQVIWEGNAH